MSPWISAPKHGHYAHEHPYTRPLNRRELEYMGADEDALVDAWLDTWDHFRVVVEQFFEDNDPDLTEDYSDLLDQTENELLLGWQPVFERLVSNIGEHTLNQPTYYPELPVEKARNPFRAGTPAYERWRARNGLAPTRVKQPTTPPLKDPLEFFREAGRKLALDAIQGITGKQKTAVRKVLVDAIKAKRKPKEIGKQLVRMLGLHARWAKAVENYRAAAIRGGMSEKMADYRARVYSDKLLRKRGIMVARTELTRAQNAGMYAAWQQKEARGDLAGYVVEKWLQPKPGACAECWAAADPDATGTPRVVKGLGTMFQTDEGMDIQYPPIHSHCRCIAMYRLAWE